MLFENITMIDENYQVQKNMFIEIKGNKIAYIGSNAPSDYQGERYNGAGKLAMPGFFNTHCHVPMTLLRGYGEGLPLHRWLHERVFPFEAKLTEDAIYWGTLLGTAEMIASGVTSFTDMYFKLESMCKAVNQSGIKANICNGVTSHITSDQRLKETGAYTDYTNALSYVGSLNHDRIALDMGIHAEYTSNVPIIEDVVELARDNDLRLHIHLSETKSEHEECKIRRGKTPTEYFNQLGVFENPTTCAHCVWVEDGDIEILANPNITVAHCPSSNLKLGSGVAPIIEMINKGVRVAIGTDGASSNNNLNMLEEISLAAMVQKGFTQNPLALSTSQLVEISSRNGAISQGREDCGSIKVGNRGDIIVLNTDAPHLQPEFDLLANVFYSAQSSDIVLNMVDGEVLYENGEFKTIDIERVMFEANRAVEKTLSDIG